MEDLTNLQTLADQPSCSAFSFPPYRRRPLRSRTYNTLVQILSHCRSELPQPHTLGNSSSIEFRLVSEDNETINRADEYSADVLAPNPNCKELGDALVEETGIDKSRENVGCRDGCSDSNKLSVEESDCIRLGADEEMEAERATSISVADFWLDNEPTGAVEVEQEQKNSSSALDFQMDGVGSTGELEFDQEFSICDFSEVLDSCSGMDIVFESSKVGEGDKGHGSDLEGDRPKESEHLLQLKTMELEKLISDSGVADSFCRGARDEEIEEGEISGEDGVDEEWLTALSEDAVSQADKTIGVVHASEDNADKHEERGRWSHDISGPSIINIASRDSDPKLAELRATTSQVQNNHYQNEFHYSYMETHRFGPLASSLENLPPPGRDLQENAVQENAAGNISASTEKDGDLGKKKRKKGPLTKERRAKKKRKEKIKRAEKNRKLGIKRLKLQPNLKPKTISYCRHYLQGRCHEGEKCKFSHDTVPLTKSTPCSYFARQSCMKGDDCPFDHDLSKYPCNNYTSQGFCSRGSGCLFSHEIPAKQSFSTTPSVSKPNLKPEHRSMPTPKVVQPSKLALPLNNSNYSENGDNRGTFPQKIAAKFCTGEKTSNKSTEQLPEPVRTARQIPKGVSFLSPGGMSHSDTSKLKGDGLSSKADNGVDAHKTTFNSPASINKNEVPVVEAPRRPRGINFLSFAQKSPLDDTSRKMISNFFSNGHNETGKSVVGDFAAGKQSHSLMGSGDIVKVNRQTSQSATDIVLNLNEGANRIPRMTESQPISNLAYGETSSVKLQDAIKKPSLSFDGFVTDRDANTSYSLKTSIFSNTPSLVQKAVQSTLAFAAKFEPNIKVDHSFIGGKASSQSIREM